MLEAGWPQHGREGADHPRFVLITEIRTDRAAAVTQVLGGLGQDPLAAATPDARPLRSEKRPIEAPDRVAGLDFLQFRVHRANRRRTHDRGPAQVRGYAIWGMFDAAG